VKKLLYSQKVAPYIFVLPFVLSFALFFLYPTISTIIMSFQEILPGEITFVGLKNYQRLLNPIFYKALLNSVRYTFWTLVILIPLPMILAVFLNNPRMPARNFFRASLFIPILTSTIVAGTVFRLLFGEMDTAFVNSFLLSLGLAGKKWLRDANFAVFIMVILCCWRWMGVNILYYLSGLQAIPNELYEAAEIDGAGMFSKFRYITFPLLKPVAIYVLTISIYGGFRMFEESYVYWADRSPGNIGLTIVVYLYRRGFQENDFGFGSAIGMVLLTLVFVVNIIQLLLTGVFKKEAYL
jgi:arabinosaccharide transport system permease protein